MNTRMDKYKNDDTPKRVDKNREIYTRVDEKDIEDLNMTSNIAILDADTQNLDIEALKSILDKKYSKRTTTNLEEFDEEPDELEITKEYDLNKVISAARENSGNDYERNRYKKVRESEFEILNSLNLKNVKEDDKQEETPSSEEETLMNLIKTVNENELKKKDILDDIDLLNDLKGNDNTEVLEPIVDSDLDTDTLNKPTIIEELEKTKKLSRTDILEGLEENEEQSKSNKEESAMQIQGDEDLDVSQNTFYTGKLTIKESDLDDFNDLRKEMDNGNAIIKILILLGILVLLAIIVFLANKYLNLGLF